MRQRFARHPKSTYYTHCTGAVPILRFDESKTSCEKEHRCPSCVKNLSETRHYRRKIQSSVL
jgi:hypothetical protein